MQIVDGHMSYAYEKSYTQLNMQQLINCAPIQQTMDCLVSFSL